MNVEFESDYRARILFIRFPEKTEISTCAQILKLRSLWTEALRSWHSPYKALIECKNLYIAAPHSTEEQRKFNKAWEHFFAFLKGFHLQKMAGYLGDNTKVETYPFTTFATIEEACAYLGLRDFNKTVTKPGDFRSSIAFDNQFRQHTIEMSFASPQKIDSKKKINLLKSKLTNNLMQWHSKWNLLINCTHLEIEPDMFEDFENMIQFFKGFFLTSLIGYGPANKGAQYPFPIFRSRHKAAAQLTSIGNIAAEEANCNSRKKQP